MLHVSRKRYYSLLLTRYADFIEIIVLRVLVESDTVF